LDHEDDQFIVFAQIYFNTQLIVDFRESLNVWVCLFDQFLSYPTKPFMEGFKDYVGTFYKSGTPVFGIVYRTEWGHLQMLVYQLSTEYNNRLVKNITLDKEHCPSHMVDVRFSKPKNYVYFTYICKETKNIKVYKFSNYLGYNLILSNDTSIYTVQTGEPIDQTFKLESQLYENTISAKVKSVLFKETHAKTQKMDLEKNGNLELSGDVFKAEISQENTRVQLLNRLEVDQVISLKHNSDLISNFKLQLSKDTKEETARVVSDEYIVHDQDSQNNNFFTSCVKPSVVNLQPDKAYFEKLYICKGVDNLKFYLTDFLSVKLRVRLGLVNINQPVIVISNNFLYLFNKFNSISQIVFNKFSLIKTSRGLLNQISFGQILNPNLSNSFKGIQYFHIGNYTQSNSLFIFRKHFNSNKLSILEMNLNDETTKYSEIEQIELLSITDSPLYFR
jgi:hypothetical protein